jgi:hypothetical protein
VPPKTANISPKLGQITERVPLTDDDDDKLPGTSAEKGKGNEREKAQERNGMTVEIF